LATPAKNLKQLVAELVSRDPRFRSLAPGVGVLCPWCAGPTFGDVSGEALVEAVIAHLEEGCPSARGDPASPMLAVVALDQKARFLHLKRRFSTEVCFRVFGPEGNWICPYCGDPQQISSTGPDGKRLSTDHLVHAIGRHLGRCFPYQERPGSPMTVEQLKDRIAAAARQKKLTEQVAELMKTNPVMQFRDAGDRWVCPFCKQAVEYVDMSTPLLREHAAPTQVAKHLSDDCPEARRNPTLTATEEEMRAAVEALNARAPTRPRVVKEARAAQKDETAYLKSLRAEVLTLRDEVKRNQELAQSLERARSVQARMLPSKLPRVPGYDFHALFRSCEQVSGDFYDVFEIGGGRLAIVIGDVSGHGLEAALVMGMVKKAFNVRAKEDISAAAVMRKVNADIFPDLKQGTFITAAFAILDPARNSLAFARAGHNPALLLRASTGEVQSVAPAGMMLGIDRGPRFDRALEQAKIELAPGDLLVQYTDGVTEAMDPADQEFGLARLTEAMARAARSSAAAVTTEIVSSVERFAGPRRQEDDITLVVVRREPVAGT